MRSYIPSAALSAAILLLLPPALCAVQQNTSAPATVVLRSQWNGAGCPVSFAVQRTSPTEVINIDRAAQHRGSQRIHLSFNPLDTSGVRRAEVTVHATSLRGRILPLGNPDSTPELDRNFQISGPAASSLRQKELWIDGVGTVLSVDLTSITYLDGTTWRGSPGSICRAIPDSFMLVGGR